MIDADVKTVVLDRGFGLTERLRYGFQVVTGELSVLRSTLWQGFSNQWSQPYVLDTTRVDAKLARELYRNANDKYKLGAGFARPIINIVAGFVGPPQFKHDEVDTQQTLTDFFSRHVGKLLEINRNTLRDGDCFVRIDRLADRFGGEDAFELRMHPPEWVTPVFAPLTQEWERVVIKHPVIVVDKQQRQQSWMVTETITPDEIVIQADEQAPPELKTLNGTKPNPWGFIPMVHFKNEAEEGALYGVSELEPVEPFLKAYHDVALHAIQGSRIFSRPKVKFKISDVQSFLKNNFSAEELRAGRVSFANKELFIMRQDEDVDLISGASGIEGVTALMEMIFYCIVDVSEIPEFAFGAAVASSKGSVAEQQIPISKKIDRKRGQFAPYYVQLARMYLAMEDRAAGVVSLADRRARPDLAGVTVGFDEISQKDEVNTATAIRTTVEAMAIAMKAGLISPEAAVEHLRKLIPTMLPWSRPGALVDEQTRINAGLAYMKKIAEAVAPPEPDGGLPQGRPPGPSRPTNADRTRAA